MDVSTLGVSKLLSDVATVQEGINLQPQLVTAVYTGSLANIGTATLAALDALGREKRNVKAKVWISGATAGAGITPHWFQTTHNNLTAFVEQTVPSLGAQHVLAAAAIEDYHDLGNLPEDCQAELRMDSAGNDSGLTYIVYLSYEV